jgi:hypothetical protein
MEQEKIEQDKKTCNKCGSDDFYKFADGKSRCKPCTQKYCKKYKRKNKDKISQYNAVYKKENRVAVSEYNRKYNTENRETIQKRHGKYLAMYRKTNFNHKFAEVTRKRITALIKAKQMRKKADHTLNMIDCSKETLVKWLQYNLQEGMTLQNHGKVWHIDHTIPCSLFQLNEETEQRRCFHWSNVKPMLVLENHSKGNKYSQEEVNTYKEKAATFCKENNLVLNDFTLGQYNTQKYIDESQKVKPRGRYSKSNNTTTGKDNPQPKNGPTTLREHEGEETLAT